MKNTAEKIEWNGKVISPFEHNLVGDELIGLYHVLVSAGDTCKRSKDSGDIHLMKVLREDIARALEFRDFVAKGGKANPGAGGSA